MTDLIDREVARKILCDSQCEAKLTNNPFDTCGTRCRLMMAIDSIPKTDAVEVVRCEDCRYAHDCTILGEARFECGLNGRITEAGNYCDRGRILTNVEAG